MTCYSSSINPVPICGGPAILIYLQPPAAQNPTPVWVTADCDAGEILGFNYFEDEAATIRLTGFSIADRVPTPTDARGLSCAGAMLTNLCPATLDKLEAQTHEQTTALLPVNYSYSGFTYDSDGNLLTIVRTVDGVSQRKTMTYTGGLLATASAWVNI